VQNLIAYFPSRPVAQSFAHRIGGTRLFLSVSWATDTPDADAELAVRGFQAELVVTPEGEVVAGEV
jgi:hypothetical protein